MSTISEPACYVVFEKEGKILFVLRENTGFMDGAYSLPAGRVEWGETYADAAIREAHEEVGLKIIPTDLEHIFTQHRWTKGQKVEARTDVFFYATHWAGEPVNGEPEKHRKIEWISKDDLPENIMDYQFHAIKSWLNGQTYGEHGWSDIVK